MRSVTDYQLCKGVNYTIPEYFIIHYKYTAFTWDKAIRHIEYMWHNSVAWERVYEIARACANIFGVRTARARDCCAVDRLLLGSRRRAAQKRACVVWERVSVIYSRLCVWCACDADLGDTLVSTHPLNHGRSVVKNVIRIVKYAEHVFVSDAWVNRFPALAVSVTVCAWLCWRLAEKIHLVLGSTGVDTVMRDWNDVAS